jgi:hypothetical protein
LTTPRSEFHQLTSSSQTDFVALDFSGAREVLVYCSSTNNGDANESDGSLTNQLRNTQAAAEGVPLYAKFAPIVIHSTDDRLYWVSNGGFAAVLHVWVMR